MLPDKEAALLLVGDGLSGAGVLQWVAARADLWLLVFRCAQLISKAHSSATQLEQIFRVNEEEDTTSGATVEVEEPESWREQDTDWWPETLNNVGLSPPNSISQRETMQITQPASAPTSPLASPSNLNGGTFSLASSPGQCTVDPNWQATKPTVRERNAAMFNNELMADIRFIVGSPGHTQSIPAHKYVLATGSSVFYAMFYGGLAENKEEIEVPDVEPSAFLTLLKYLYCDEIQLEADTVLATLYVAKKYIVPHLARACVNYLETSLTAKNACLLLSQSRLFEEPELMQRCWEVIDAQVRLSRSLTTLRLDDSEDCIIARDNSPLTPPIGQLVP